MIANFICVISLTVLLCTPSSVAARSSMSKPAAAQPKPVAQGNAAAKSAAPLVRPAFTDEEGLKVYISIRRLLGRGLRGCVLSSATGRNA
jgi:hypothetical protein